MTRVIRIPNGKQVTLAAYVREWKHLKQLPPDTEASGWQWYPVKVRDVLRDLRYGVHDRINQRGGLQIRTASDKRTLRHLRQRVRHDCRWCGSPLGRYALSHERYCDAGCRRAYL